MKKINVFLIIIVSILGVVSALSDLDRSIAFILKDLSIVITISLTYILSKVFKIHINEYFSFIYIIFIFMAHYLGVIERFYGEFAYYDKIVHTLSGILASYAAYLFLKAKGIKDTLLNIIFIISFTFLCAGMWEIFEFVCNIFFGGDAQKVVETGVDDTMLDIIVAFIGSLIFTLFITIKSKLIKH